MTDGRRMTRKTLIAAGATAAAGTGVGIGVVLATGKPAPPKLQTELTASFLDGELPIEDPEDGDWGRAKPIGVALNAQQVVPPILKEKTLAQLSARALHNGRELAFLLEWDDEDVDDLDGISRYRDAVAIQLPSRATKTPPPVTMGGPGQPVHVLQWRATWQRDIDHGRTATQNLFPRIVRDLTPSQLLGPETGAEYEVGRAVGNPLAREHTSPVEEIVAEGFGTVTHVQRQSARGRGVWASGGWRVAVGIPLARSDTGEPLTRASAWPVAFAVWLGSKDNRGARKHWADWVRVDLEQP